MGDRPIPALIREITSAEAKDWLNDWLWRLPAKAMPLFVTYLADWVFGAPDGSLWRLDSLEGDYVQIAANAQEYNQRKKSSAWVYETFLADWYDIAVGNGLIPKADQCIGWKVHPIVGGELEVQNLKLFDARLYHSLMGQLHRQVR